MPGDITPGVFFDYEVPRERETPEPTLNKFITTALHEEEIRTIPALEKNYACYNRDNVNTQK